MTQICPLLLVSKKHLVHENEDAAMRKHKLHKN